MKVQGGILDQVLREVEVECLPGDIPAHIEADISALVFGTVLRVDDLPHGGKLKFVTDGGNTVAHVVTIKEEVAAVSAEDALALAGAAEPEVAKKGKAEAEVEAKK